jgi:hypothetical protein
LFRDERFPDEYNEIVCDFNHFQLYVLYLARRAVPFDLDKGEEEVLEIMRKDYGTEPIPCSIPYDQVRQTVDMRFNQYNVTKVSMHCAIVQSNKSSNLFPRSAGEFNGFVGYFSSLLELTKPTQITDTEFVDNLVYQSETNTTKYVGCFKFSIAMIDSLIDRGRLPHLFVSSISERGKTRIPGITEGHCSIVARTISHSLYKILAKAFPSFRDFSKMHIRAGRFHTSGDYKLSTAAPSFEFAKQLIHHAIE